VDIFDVFTKLCYILTIVIQLQEVLEYYTVRLARSKLVIDIKTAVLWDVILP